MATRRGEGVARAERLRLCDLFEEKGPLAPTLCTGWTTSDLAAHLFVREARPWAAVGAVVGALAPLTDTAMDRAKRSIGYEGIVDRLRTGPHAIARPFDDQLNTVEFFVHHEDVRRAESPPLPPREDAELDEATYRTVRLGARLLARRLRGVTLDLVAPGRDVVSISKGGPRATLTGGPQELLLYLFGRRGAARVELAGADEAVAAVNGARLGL